MRRTTGGSVGRSDTSGLRSVAPPPGLQRAVNASMDVKLPVVTVYTTVGAISDAHCVDAEYVQPFIEP